MAERKIFSCGSFTLMSFLSTSQLCALKLHALLDGECLCKGSGQEERAGDGTKSRQTLFLQTTWPGAKETNLS